MKKFFTFLLVVILVLGCFRFCSRIMDSDDAKGGDSEQTEADSAIDWTADSVAMEQSTHLKFKGVPIDGSLEQFVTRMGRRGFEAVSDRSAEEQHLVGDFAGFKECDVYVSTLDNNDLVAQITVCFPSQEQWKYLYGDYKNLKDMLIEKYGRPTSCVERIDRLYDTDESSRMSAINMGNYKYNTRFSTDEGDIILSIEHRSFRLCFVQLVYRDKENGETVRDAAMEDL